VIFEQQRIIRVHPGASFIGRTVHKEVFIDYEKLESTIECSFRSFRMSVLPTTVPSSCATLDLIGAPGSSRDFSVRRCRVFLVQLFGKDPTATGSRCEN
jgi:hypothetical protein